MRALLSFGTRGFPLWVLVASLVALVRPEAFTWFGGRWIPLGLGLIMLGMGLTLEVADFRRSSGGRRRSGWGWRSSSC